MEEVLPSITKIVVDATHAAIQQQLAKLGQAVQHILPELVITQSRTHGSHFLLFSYYTFCLPVQTHSDKIAAGVFLKQRATPRTVIMAADISWERHGGILAGPYEKAVPHNGGLVYQAELLTEMLLPHGPLIIDALHNGPSR